MIEIILLVSSVLFIFALKLFGRPSTAHRANTFAMLAMALAVFSAFNFDFSNYDSAFYITIIVSGLLGVLISKRVQMTQMPELVGLFNGFGGGASGAIAYVELSKSTLPLSDYFVAIFSMVIGMFTFSGSIIAVLKLRGKLNNVNTTIANIFSAFLPPLILLPAIWESEILSLEYFMLLSLIAGIIRVAVIGGADMPVVIAFLNSLSGIAAMSAGFIVNSIILIIAGALVGASGIILTLLMCAAMNRTLLDVLKGGFGSKSINNEYDKDPISTSPEDVAIQLSYAESVIIVPGYGMAVAQAQSAVKELTNTLKDKNIEVKFAIHPVAGRMPGHMNVLLAEVDIDYEDMYTLEDINSEFSSTDVVIVLGANDVVNPLARTDEDSPIYGMPILDVDLAKQVIVIKRSMSPGYAGISNPLFINDNAKMLFADAKEGLEKIIKSFELV
ncbi:MAG: NAD(P)(+) transhydrogenase (Re/Si-specific) subunit beta [Actinomycetota bacterium]|jgi:NAD(P) transhydrogenase subunit beta|nr:NAD(P)(+) transhydrogenase (Re/Si-specific) subunit beta [Actinomycetota bacterium]MDA3008377.1 NAD(P)(+) transhydrogenase (Re/Si-specific) subunit beta [Actinomycetota bacterium]MDA3037800.1 NAD(P)(+) transhydrogenase (Re/Si-specific) subunit beta [Actinomycetota bacterium]